MNERTTYEQTKETVMHQLVNTLNHHRHLYYNLNAPTLSDAAYDRLYDQLVELEKSTGIILSNSPTQTVGYSPVSALEKVKHPIPLLSLDKTKQFPDIYRMVQIAPLLLMLKLDGLTVKLCYEDGRLIQASTRGDGEEGELITHNASVFRNIPLTIPYKGKLTITGEGLMHRQDFERLKETLLDSNGKPYRNARNLAAGSIRALNPEICKERCIHFYAFNILEGLEEQEDMIDSRHLLLDALADFGFELCPYIYITPDTSPDQVEEYMTTLQELAASMDIPIDGLVARYDSMSYSKSLGRTGHHYRDGMAYKFEDETYETVFRSIEWTPGRSGELAPVALFDTVEIDGCEVSRASLHNISFIKDLELYPGCRILVSKRNMIIPHVEDNLDREHFDQTLIPDTCPCCGKPVRLFARQTDKKRLVETLHCDNPDCDSQNLKKFVHFVEKKAMNIVGLSEATLEKFIELGYLKSFQDIYHLNDYRDSIVALEGFGEKSYERLWASIESSRNTSFVRFVVAMDIPMIGRTASRELDRYFNGNLRELELAAMDYFDFTALSTFGETMSRNIHEWFHNSDHLLLWRNLQKEMHFETNHLSQTKEGNTMSEQKNNPFNGCTIVATGKLENFTRDSINSKIISLGAIAGSSVTQKTDYLICGEKAGSKLAKAQELGITILTEQQFLNMLSA